MKTSVIKSPLSPLSLTNTHSSTQPSTPEVYHTHTHTYASTQGGWGHWAVYYTGSLKFYINILLFVGSTTLGTKVNFHWLDHSAECSNVLTTNCNLQKANFVYNQCECSWIYRPLSYPFRSLAGINPYTYNSHKNTQKHTISTRLVHWDELCLTFV